MIPIAIPPTKTIRFKAGKDVARLGLALDDLALRETDVVVLDADGTSGVVRVWLLDGDGAEVSGSYVELASQAAGRFVDADGGAYLDLPVPARCGEPVEVTFSVHAGGLAFGPLFIVVPDPCAG